jgi:protein ImuA
MPALQPVSLFDVPAVEQPSGMPEGLRPDVWHAHALAGAPQQVQATGNATLDAQLPGGGWPVGAMTELLQPAHVHSEWRLLLPALGACGQGPVVLVGAPHLPFAPALAAQGLHSQRLLCVGMGTGHGSGAASARVVPERLWSTEQALRCAAVDAVLLWLPPGAVRTDQLRRLQMAAASHHKLLFVMRDAQARTDASPAVLRLEVWPACPTHSTAVPVCEGGDDALQVHVLKRRGPPQEQPLYLSARTPRLAMLLVAVQHDRPMNHLRPTPHALARTARCA